MATIQVNNIKFNVLELNKGASETIVMAHGMFSNLSVFYFKIAPELAKRYHIVLYDLRSHGMTQVVDNGYEIETMTDDLIGLMDQLKLSKVHVVGYSFGGLIALDVALRYPDRVKDIVVMESPNPNDEEPSKLLDKYSKEFLIQSSEAFKKSTNLSPTRRQLEKSHRLFEYLSKSSTFISDMSAYRDFFSVESIESISQKVLLIYAKNSDCLEAGEFLHKHIKNSTLIIGDGDHNLPIQNPGWVAEQLDNFF